LQAGRPDLARAEIARASQADPQHLYFPALAFAAEQTLAEGQWDACLSYAADLEKRARAGGVPAPIQVGEWRGRAYQGLGKVADAKKAYQQLVTDFPDQSTGYALMVNILLNVKDDSALSWLERWRAKFPDDPAALNAQIRVLCRAGKADQADREAKTFLDDQLTKLRARQAKELEDNRPGSDADRQARLKSNEQAATATEMDITYSVARAFDREAALDKAEAWAEIALALAQKMPEPPRNDNVAGVRLLLGETCIVRLQPLRDPAQRKPYVDRAIEQYQAVRETSPGNAMASGNLAWLLSQDRHDTDAACAVIKSFLEAPPSQKPTTGDRLDLNTLDTIGVVYCASPQHAQDAVELFEQAAGRYPDDPRVFLYLGRAYAGLGKNKRAEETLNKSVRLAINQADNAKGAERKQWEDLADEARRRMKELKRS